MSASEIDRQWRNVLREGETCWRIAEAQRASVIVETADYFAALREVCREAKRSIFIIGWDFDRRERIGRAAKDPTFEDFLCGLLDDQPDLHVYLLCWDYAFIYARNGSGSRNCACDLPALTGPVVKLARPLTHSLREE